MAPQTGRRLDRLIVVGLALAIIAVLADRYLPRHRAESQAVTLPAEPAPVAVQPRSIAVLPFVNMSNDPGNEYFSDGMSEEILNTLARIDGLRVAARTSSFQFKGQGADVAEVGRRLKVGAIVEGSVRKEGKAVRITAQLIDAKNGYQLWSQTLENVFAVQTEIATQIAQALQIELGEPDSGVSASELRALPTTNARAYELFLQGRHLWRQRNGPAVTRAIELLTQAVELDPQFAEAHAALASAWFVGANVSAMDIAKAREGAVEAAHRARALDPTLAEPLAVEAALAFDQGRWSDSERMYRRAIELQPDEPTSHHYLAMQFLASGYLVDFAAEAKVAYGLDPANAAIAGLPGSQLLLKGDPAGAQPYFEKAVALGASRTALVRLPQSLYESGHPDQALAVERQAYEKMGLDPRRLDLVHAAMLDPLRRAAARDAILSKSGATTDAFTRIYDLMRIGDLDGAVDEALTAPDAVPRDLLFNVWYPSAAAMRRSAAFKRFAREVGLVDYWRERGWPDLCRPAGEDFECR